MWQVRTRRGRQYYYRHPESVVPYRDLRPHLAVELLSNGRLATAPPTIVREDRRAGKLFAAHTYSFEQTPGSLDDVPVFDPSWLPAKPRQEPPRPAPRRAGVDVGDAEAIRRARLYLAKVQRPIVGQASDSMTFQMACRLVRGFDLPPEAATYLLVEWSGFDRRWVASKVRSAVAHGNEPMGTLREGNTPRRLP